MTVINAILLGIIQGLTEFLPVSSSGHLAFAQSLLNVPADKVLFLIVMLHIGTLFSVFFVYYKDILLIVKEFALMICECFLGKGFNASNEHRKLGIMIIVATVPTGLMGIFLGDIFESFYTSQLIIGISLIITGCLLWTAEKIHKSHRNIKDMHWFDAVIVGIFQGFAITPGISRSGATIVGSLLMGFNKELATKFSFLISIPAILGATLLEAKSVLIFGIGDLTYGILFAGIISSFLAGVLAIRALINFIKKEKLFYFSYYTWTIGFLVIIYSILS